MSNMTDRDFVKNFSLMTAALAALAVVIFIIAQVMGSKTTAISAADNPEEQQTLAQRIKPVGEFSTASAVMNAVVPVASAATDGKATYSTSCAACHGTGAAGAPKLGDKAEWTARIAQGKDVLYKHALGGYQGKKGFMPAKGGNGSLSDDAVKAAVDHMVAASK